MLQLNEEHDLMRLETGSAHDNCDDQLTDPKSTTLLALWNEMRPLLVQLSADVPSSKPAE